MREINFFYILKVRDHHHVKQSKQEEERSNQKVNRSTQDRSKKSKHGKRKETVKGEKNV
jgi:hypothetical protein